MVRSSLLWAVLVSSAGFSIACGSNPAINTPPDPFDAGSGHDGDASGGANGDDGGGLVVGTGDAGAALPKVAVKAFLGDVAVKVGWSVDRGDLASISPGAGSQTTLIPTGNAGGEVTVKAVLDKQQADVTITIQIRGEQNGADPSVPGQALQIPSSVGKLTEGGGPGEIGGQGLGVAITDKAVLEALDKPGSDGTDSKLKLVYPYDGTV